MWKNKDTLSHARSEEHTATRGVARAEFQLHFVLPAKIFHRHKPFQPLCWEASLTRWQNGLLIKLLRVFTCARVHVCVCMCMRVCVGVSVRVHVCVWVCTCLRNDPGNLFDLVPSLCTELFLQGPCLPAHVLLWALCSRKTCTVISAMFVH